MRSLFSLTLLALSISAHAQVIDLKNDNPSLAPASHGWGMGVFKNKTIWTTVGNYPNYQTHMYQCGADNKLIEINKPVGSHQEWIYNFPYNAVINGTMYFSVRPDSTYAEYRLCTWDGVTDPVFLTPNYNSKDPHRPVVLDNKLYFTYSLVQNMNKVAMYDPASNTYQALPSSLDNIIVTIPFNDKLYCSKYPDLYVYDPKTNSVSLAPGSGTDYGTPFSIAELNNKLYFIAVSHPGTSFGLYEYDGINTPKKISGSLRISAPNEIYRSHLGLYKGEIYFSADTLAKGINLYKYNPQSGTLTPVHTFATDPASDFTVFNDKLLFVASDLRINAELWQYDGMAAPTLLADINGTIVGSAINSLTVANGTVYFVARNTSGFSIYRLAGGLDVLELANAIEEVKLFPNPAADVATLSFNLKKNATISAVINDITGKEVYRLTQQAPAGVTKMNLDIGKLVPGNYTYRLMGDDNKLYASGKFVKN